MFVILGLFVMSVYLNIFDYAFLGLKVVDFS